MDDDKEKVEEEATFTEAKCDCGSCSDKETKKAVVKNNSTTVFVLGVLSALLGLWNPILAILGFILGIIAVAKGHKTRKIEKEPGLATAGWILGIIGMVICGVIIVYGLCHIATFALPYHYYYSRTFHF